MTKETLEQRGGDVGHLGQLLVWMGSLRLAGRHLIGGHFEAAH
ncbi:MULTISPECIES: hypothetical protein [Streptomyces]|uniref:Uncharacterized protein n=1 Tax=Streptomyces flaveolus TaxID=67297 RepID=A0ABV1VJT1_9ACTN